MQGEFGGSNPASLSEYYSAATGVPSSGNPISLSDFYGTANTVVRFSFAIQGAGGAGGWGLSDGGSGTGSGFRRTSLASQAQGMTTVNALRVVRVALTRVSALVR